MLAASNQAIIVHLVAQQWNQKSQPNQGGDLTKHAGAGPRLPAPANKRLIVQPRQSHDITTTEAAVPVKNQFGSQDKEDFKQPAVA